MLGRIDGFIFLCNPDRDTIHVLTCDTKSLHRVISFEGIHSELGIVVDVFTSAIMMWIIQLIKNKKHTQTTELIS